MTTPQRSGLSAVPAPGDDADLPARLQRFYEGLGERRHEALVDLPTLFTEDIEFWDPFRHTRGLPALRGLFERWLSQYPSIDFTEFRFEGDAARFTLTYAMQMRMRLGPTFSTSMASLVRTRDGRVSELRDYYDFISGVLSPVPVLGRAYRGVVNRLFL